MTPQYVASAQLFVSTDSTESDLAAIAQGGNFTQQRVKSYADLVTIPMVLQPVIDELALHTTSDGLAERISADAPVGTVLINVTVRDTSGAQAARIANAVADRFTTAVTELEHAGAESRSPVSVVVVRRATVPVAPASPHVALNIVMGVLLGFAVGLGSGLLRETLDTSVRSPEVLEQLGAPSMLGSIAFDPVAAAGAPITRDDTQSLRAEAFRQVRTNLQFVDVDKPPRSFVVTSSVPGEGKSTTTCNLAVTLARAGHRVALVEADLRRPTLGNYLGLAHGAGLTTALVGAADVQDLMQPWGEDGHLHVLTAGPTPPNPSELLGSRQMYDLIRCLQDRYDYVVIDAPPLLPVTDAAVLSKVADGVLMIVRFGKTRREQVRRALDLLGAVDARVLGMVLNMTPSKGRDAYSYGYYYNYRSSAETSRRLSLRRGRRTHRGRGLVTAGR
jgi:non-specific protein-tyrosine kinase